MTVAFTAPCTNISTTTTTTTKMSQCADFDRDTSGSASKLDLYVFCHTTSWCVFHICPFFVQTVAIMRDIKRSMLTVAVTYWRGYLSSQSRPSVGEGPPSTETIGVVRGTKLYCSMTEAQVAACELVWRRYVKTGQPGVEPVILNALSNSVDAISIPSTLFTFVKPSNRIDIYCRQRLV